jgi:putative aminopeptidase FrvX
MPVTSPGWEIIGRTFGGRCCSWEMLQSSQLRCRQIGGWWAVAVYFVGKHVVAKLQADAVDGIILSRPTHFLLPTLVNRNVKE